MGLGKASEEEFTASPRTRAAPMLPGVAPGFHQFYVSAFIAETAPCSAASRNALAVMILERSKVPES